MLATELYSLTKPPPIRFQIPLRTPLTRLRNSHRKTTTTTSQNVDPRTAPVTRKQYRPNSPKPNRLDPIINAVRTSKARACHRSASWRRERCSGIAIVSSCTDRGSEVDFSFRNPEAIWTIRYALDIDCRTNNTPDRWSSCRRAKFQQHLLTQVTRISIYQELQQHATLVHSLHANASKHSAKEVKSQDITSTDRSSIPANLRGSRRRQNPLFRESECDWRQSRANFARRKNLLPSLVRPRQISLGASWLIWGTLGTARLLPTILLNTRGFVSGCWKWWKALHVTQKATQWP